MSTAVEEAVLFGEATPLVGVITPGRRGAELPAVLLLNAGLLHHIGPQRMNVQIARALSEQGAASLRFDCSGIGDSPPRRDHKPFAQASIDETREAMDFMAARDGNQRFVLLGLCSGADQAFQVAQLDERVVGVVLLDPYPYATRGFQVQRVWRPLRRPATWKRALTGDYNVTYRVLKRLAGEYEPVLDATLVVRDIPERADAEAGYHRMIGRGASVYVVFTAGQLGTFNHSEQFWRMHPSLPRTNPLLRYSYFEMADHTMSMGPVREILIDHVIRWYREQFGSG